ncbi:MAG: hypothetical protein A2020_08380 [Lentisphaerae bacterium GWF2_45_14]|nr:MAG: hypothetical protein A2020_08380 [Lentisphaerae bacterium GWF2_45_14]
MDRNVYGNFILTMLLIITAFSAYIIVKSVDGLSMRTEKVFAQNVSLENEINGIKKQLNSVRFTVGSQIEKNNHIAAEKMANSEFYDVNAVSGGRLITATESDTKNMNTIINNDSFASNVWGYCSDALAERNYKNIDNFEPQLAESWKLSEDKMIYHIKLKKGILWHDFKDPVSGKEWKDIEVTAHDFKFYVDVVKNEKVESPFQRIYLQDLDRIEVINNYEFNVVWSKKYIKSEETTLGLSPLPRHLYYTYDGPFDPVKFNEDHERNKIVVGCGPYRFVKWNRNLSVVLKKWEKYYGGRFGASPSLEYIEIDVINHQNTRFQAMLSRKIDMINFTPEQWIFKTSTPEFDPEKGFIRKYKYPRRAYYYIGYNLTKPLFQDKRVRQALSHCIDRERIIKDVYYGLGRIVTGPFFIDSIYYDKSITPYSFSIKKARELMKEAGWIDSDNDGILDKNGEKFEFTILQVAGSEIQKKMLPIIKEDLEKAGIIMKIQTIEWSVLTERLENKNFEACTLGWTAALVPDEYQIWHSSQAGIKASSNHIGFRNPEADALIEKIRISFDMKERIRLAHDFHRLLHELQPYTFLFTPDNLIGMDARYKNVRVFPLGIPDRITWVPTDKQMPLPE